MVQRIGRVASLDTLRGLSALAVCWYHFSGISMIGAGPIRSSGAYGWLGVEVFFVISGFVIPLALLREGYSLSNYKTFLLKRLARLYPPYLASVTVGFALLAIYSIYKGQPRVDLDPNDLLLHLGLLNDLFGRPWLNNVYWSLAIEFQFYLMIGLFFPLLFSSEPWRRYVGYAAFVLPMFALPSSIFLFHFSLLFLMGILRIQYSSGLLRRLEYLTLLIVCSVGILLLTGLVVLCAALFTIGVITFLNRRIPLLDNLGRISYSFYLLHGSLGSLVLFVLLRFTMVSSELEKLLAVLLSVFASACFATVAYYLIELPAIRCSSGIDYRKPEDKEPVPRETVVDGGLLPG
ncbi:MAG TPA: acyltransferase [Pyrinomonadaceae bacterium]|nr:acyltransferase [Pyrinomonadaceae bacterium]